MEQRTRSRTRGYLMIEFLLAAAVGLLVTAVGIPVGIHTTRWLHLRSATHEFARELQRARLQSITENAALRMQVITTENRYQIVSTAEGTPARGAAHNLAAGVAFQSLPTRAVVFHPWGTASPAGSYILAGLAGRLRVVVHLTGRVRVEELAP